MDREEILRSFDVDEHGIIRTPGKFEGEMLYMPYFWDASLYGDADEDDGRVKTFNVIDEDRAAFPELRDARTVKLYERDDGFVCEVGE